MLSKIAVLMGGASSEREVSLKSGNAVLEALKAKGIDAFAFDPSKENLLTLKDLGVTAVFIALHGSDGENGTIQGVLDYMKIPYTGSGVQACAIGLSKHYCKVLWANANLPVADYMALYKADYQILNEAELVKSVRHLGLPLFVKPNSEGSSVGVSKVNSYDELKIAIEQAYTYDELVLIEKYLAGDEFSVPVILDKVYPSIRIKSMKSFYDYEAKYLLDNTEYQCPSLLTEAQEAQIQSIALHAYHVIGCRGWARVDLMQDADGNFVLLEINTSPGMTSHSLVPKSAASVGESFEALVVKILTAAKNSE